MTTVSRLIDLVLKDAGVLGEGETASSETLQDAFDTLVSMVAQWQTSRLMVYAHRTVTLTATGDTSYTIGTGGNVNTTRPNNLIGAYYRLSGIDTPLKIIDSFEDYQNIGLKSVTGPPEYICYDPTYALGTIYLWPLPASGTVYLTLANLLTAYTSVSDNLSVPPEYELALRFSLAEMLPAVFNVPARPDIAVQAKKARTILKRNNAIIPEMGMPIATLRGMYHNIISGQ